MSKIQAGPIVQMLKKRGFLKKDKNRLWLVAAKVASCGRVLTDAMLDKLQSHFASQDQDVESFTVAALADSSWIEIVRDLLSENEDENEKYAGSSKLEFVTADNLYGWSTTGRQGDERIRLHRQWCDHDRPGEWNAFRQCYNLTDAEFAEAGAGWPPAPDYRRRGCSRPEVLGWIAPPHGWRPGQLLKPLANIRGNRTFFDPQEVADAIRSEVRA